MFLSILQILLLPLLPFLYLGIGIGATSLGAHARERMLPQLNEEGTQPWGIPHLVLLGLLLSLTSAFFLWHFGLPLPIATVAPFLFVVPFIRKTFARIRTIQFKPHPNLFLWLLTVFILGISLFEVTDGIQTPWTNNYGDLTFHLGMITSFVFGENRLPEYHLFAGESLSYPLFVNFWTASLWSISPYFKTLPLIFQFQWLLVWTLAYLFLRGDRYWILPWAILFGGGSYLYLGENSGQLIPKNVPWTVFMTTIWVPQRSALFGVATLLGALALFHDALRSEKTSQILLIRSGILFALSPLTHTHFFLAGVLYAGGTLALRAIFLSKSDIQWRENAALVLSFAAPLLATVIFLPWIVGKKGIISWSRGWITDTTIPEGERLLASTLSWLSASTSLVWLFSLVLLWAVSKRHYNLIACTAIFIAGNFVQLAVWEWDQLKLFLGLYIVGFALWSSLSDKRAFYAHFIALGLLFPAVYEVKKVYSENQSYTVYTRDEVQIAIQVRRATTPEDIIIGATANNHNSLLTLAGRRMFYGYEGTLSSHGIDYGERQQIIGDLGKIAQCSRIYSNPRVCPDLLFWGDKEREFWKIGSPGEGYFQETGVPLYRILAKGAP